MDKLKLEQGERWLRCLADVNIAKAIAVLAELARLRAETDSLDDQLTQQGAELRFMHQQRDEDLVELERLRDRVANLELDNDGLRHEAGGLNAELEQTRAERDTLAAVLSV